MVRENARRRAERGAGLVEYALALSLLVVASIGAITFLEDETGDEIDDQANCLSERPPPTTCQRPPAAPASGPDGPGGSGDPGGGGTPSTYHAVMAPPTVVATVDGSLFDVLATYVIEDAGPPPTPLPDQIVTAEVVVTASSFPGRIGQTFYVDCITASDGSCMFDFDSRWTDVDEVSLEVVAVGIDTPYAYERAPDPDAVVTRP